MRALYSHCFVSKVDVIVYHQKHHLSPVQSSRNWNLNLLIEPPQTTQTRLHPVNLIGSCYDNHMCWGRSPMQAVQLRAEGGCQLSFILARTGIIARTENVEIIDDYQGGTSV